MHRWCRLNRLHMMTSSNELIFALLVICAGNSPFTGEFPAQRQVTRSFDVFFDLRLNKRLGKQSCGWWFDTPSRPLWRQCNDISDWKVTADAVDMLSVNLQPHENSFLGRSSNVAKHPLFLHKTGMTRVINQNMCQRIHNELILI